MSPTNPPDYEHELVRAHLLITRKSYQEATDLLARLSKAGVPQTEIHRLTEMIQMHHDEGKQAAERRRAWRYQLGLQATYQRVGWFLAAIAATLYSLWNGYNAVTMGSQQGFATVITTQVYGRGGSSYPWTRPIYFDVIYSIVILAAAIAAMVVIRWLSTDTAQWEELDVPDPKRRGSF